jgi:hypothetical protein
MPSFKVWKVTRHTVLRLPSGITEVIRTDTINCGGSLEHEVCEEARHHLPPIEAQYSACELTEAEYAAYYKGEEYDEPKTQH